MARWVKETGQWAAETKTVLLQIGGPTAKTRFQNAQTPIGMVSGRCGVEQYQKLSSDKIGRPRVDLQGTIASPTPMLPPVCAVIIYSPSIMYTLSHDAPLAPLPLIRFGISTWAYKGSQAQVYKRQYAEEGICSGKSW